MKLSNIKITPLTIIIAICVFYMGFFLFDKQDSAMPGTIAKIIYTLILTVVLFVTDLLFRRMVLSGKWVWIIQSSFIILIIAMILIFKRI